MDVPQYVSPVIKKKVNNITIFKKGKGHYEMQITISYTRII